MFMLATENLLGLEQRQAQVQPANRRGSHKWKPPLEIIN